MSGPATAQVLQIGVDGEVERVGAGWQAPPTAPATRMRGGPPPAYRDAILAAAERYAISPDLLDAVARSESGYNPRAVSSAGAIGIMQLMPQTARALGVDPWNPTQNILGGAAYLRGLLDRFDGQVDLALAAYNAGPERVGRYGGVPPFTETRAYVRINLDRLADSSLAGPGAALTPALTGYVP